MGEKSADYDATAAEPCPIDQCSMVERGQSCPSQTAAAASVAARKALETLWGCGPGEVLTEYVGADVDGGPGEIPVGQICRSGAHNYAYWDGSCQFAADAASVIPPGKTA